MVGRKVFLIVLNLMGVEDMMCCDGIAFQTPYQRCRALIGIGPTVARRNPKYLMEELGVSYKVVD